ncbi:MAG TPA: pyridoxal-phosphate dependent enzyme [Candidatus Polarisedimenticolaceae bacterium]|nr:pyridoxal-phosphate dependent enzyme [Candidatus Polarisedimenticolaceae bacterium]
MNKTPQRDEPTTDQAESILLDAAETSPAAAAIDFAAVRRICSDASRPLEQRLEAFEDVHESEVGDTILSRARNVEREVGLRQIYLKFEGDNPSGTQKDRIAFAQAMDALRRGYDSITVATCGNYGVAVALAAEVAGLRCIVYVPESYHTRRVREIAQRGAEVLRVPGDYESVVEISRDRARDDEIYDANPGGANTALQLRAYGEIAYEIYDELRDAPAAVAVPVSNGTTLAGIHKGFVSLYRRGKTSRVPRMVAGSSFGKNPIVQAFRKNAPACEDLRPERIRETSVNEPLINWSSFDGDHALQSIRESQGWASYVSDRSMLRFSRIVREQQGLSVLPAATAGLIALLENHQSQPLINDRYVAILTGRRS